MRSGTFMAIVSVAIAAAFSIPVQAAPANADAGRRLVMQSCTSCHAAEATKATSDGAPPLSFMAKDNKRNPAWIRGWLMEPHPPMPGIMLNRQQIDDIIAFLNTLPTQ